MFDLDDESSFKTSKNFFFFSPTNEKKRKQEKRFCLFEEKKVELQTKFSKKIF
jgi:hypothetical protein